jgi:hypothetical protein
VISGCRRSSDEGKVVFRRQVCPPAVRGVLRTRGAGPDRPAIGEGVLFSATAAGPADSRPAFAAGISLWATALLLVSIPRLFAVPIRILGLVSAILFIITATRIFSGKQLLPTSVPLPSCAYPLLVATFISGIWTLWRECAYEQPV